MHLRRYVLPTSLTAALVAAACSGSSGDPRGPLPGPDGFSGGTEALSLLPAPAGLCDGQGSDKECVDPGGCKSSTGDTGDELGGVGGSGMSYPGPGSGGTSGVGGSYAGGGTGGTGAFGGVGGGSVVDAGTEAGGSTGGASGDGGFDCDPLPDGGALAPECGIDAGGLAGAAAFIRQPQQAPADACDALERTTPAKLYLSADDSSSMASPVIARRVIRGGSIVPLQVLRTHEFLNYYDFSFEPAKAGEVSIVPQLSSCANDGELSFQVALQAEARSRGDRALLNLTFVLDTSGSMGGEPIALEQAAVLAMAGQLRKGDIVSMVTWSTGQADILAGHVASGPDDRAVVAAARALTAEGGTDLNAGLRRGYALADQHYSPERINRVVLISDGGANVGVTDEELIGSFADDEEGEAGIYLAGIGVGDGVNDTLMDAVTDAGRGAYVYLDSVAEAEHMLGDRFLAVLDVAARNVRLEITLPWYMKVEKFFGEQISTDPEKVRPQHLGPNDAMLFFQVLRACDPALVHGDDRILLRATWETPFSRQQRDAVIDARLNDLAGDDAELTKAAAIAGYAEALTFVATNGSGPESAKAVRKALDDVRAAKGAGKDPDLIEVRELLETYLTTVGG